MTVYEVPGLSGIELWRGISGGATLFQLRENKVAYFHGLRDFLLRLHNGAAIADDERETMALKRAAGFTRTVLCGGEALNPLLEPILRSASLPFSLEIDASGPYAARHGALRVFDAMGWREGVALDLGQSQLKVITRTGEACIPRDSAVLPFGAEALDASTGRARVRRLVVEGLALARSWQGHVVAEGVVLGLPVAVGSDGIAQPATYPGLFGAIEPIFSDLFPPPWVVLNDAMLAAIGFETPREKTLVVTLGFGIGGALWET